MWLNFNAILEIIRVWKEYQLTQVKLEIDQVEERFICTKITDLQTQHNMKIIFAYAPANYQQKDKFWDDLTKSIKASTIPCIVMGI